MADNRKYYVMCGDKCLFEGMTKEQTLTAIEQAVSTGQIKNVDTGFVTKIKEQNKQTPLKFWVGTQAEYNALATKPENTLMLISDDDEIATLESLVIDCANAINTVDERIDAKYIGINTNPVVSSDVVDLHAKRAGGAVFISGKISIQSLPVITIRIADASNYPTADIFAPATILTTSNTYKAGYCKVSSNGYITVIGASDTDVAFINLSYAR